MISVQFNFPDGSVIYRTMEVVPSVGHKVCYLLFVHKVAQVIWSLHDTKYVEVYLE